MRGSIFENTPSDDGQSQGQLAQDSLSASVVELLRRGKRIDAITLYRESTGTGLKEAKDAVDALERGMGK